MNGSEKRLHDIKIRLTDSQLITVSRLAQLDDRTLADYINHVISLHCFGHSHRLPGSSCACNESDRGCEG